MSPGDSAAVQTTTCSFGIASLLEIVRITAQFSRSEAVACDGQHHDQCDNRMEANRTRTRMTNKNTGVESAREYKGHGRKTSTMLM